MKGRTRFLCMVAFCASLFSFGDAGVVGGADELPVPTHAEAAVLLVKYSGMFDRHVSADATLSDCVAFLNKTGIYFGLMEVVNGEPFELDDCARVMGQADLVLSGEAEFSGGKVKLPKAIDSWSDFCIMSNIDYFKGYGALCQALLATREMAR